MCQRVVCKYYHSSNKKRSQNYLKRHSGQNIIGNYVSLSAHTYPSLHLRVSTKNDNKQNTLLRYAVNNSLTLATVFESRERARAQNRISLKRYHIKCNNLIKYLDCIKLKLNQTMQTDMFKKLRNAKFIS